MSLMLAKDTNGVEKITFPLTDPFRNLMKTDLASMEHYWMTLSIANCGVRFAGVMQNELLVCETQIHYCHYAEWFIRKSFSNKTTHDVREHQHLDEVYIYLSNICNYFVSTYQT